MFFCVWCSRVILGVFFMTSPDYFWSFSNQSEEVKECGRVGPSFGSSTIGYLYRFFSIFYAPIVQTHSNSMEFRATCCVSSQSIIIRNCEIHPHSKSHKNVGKYRIAVLRHFIWPVTNLLLVWTAPNTAYRRDGNIQQSEL